MEETEYIQETLDVKDNLEHVIHIPMCFWQEYSKETLDTGAVRLQLHLFH